MVRKVLVIGDACEDVYIYGECSRLAPEAPIPVFTPIEKKISGGMAKNVYNNLVSLGIDCDILCSQEDINKVRYVDIKTNHMFIRVDEGEKNIKKIKDSFIEKKRLLKYDAIVISDYNKGFLTKADIEKICYIHPLTFMDTKKDLGTWCKNCDWIKINEMEYNKTRKDIKGLRSVFEDRLIVTLSDRGCRYKKTTYPVEKVEIKDLTGAGDTFLAALVSEFLKSKNIEKSITFANECATIVVQQRGVNVVNEI